MTQIKSKKVKDIREVLNSKSNDFSVYRTRLIRKGVVYSPSYGELDFTLPLFDKFVLDQAWKSIIYSSLNCIVSKTYTWYIMFT